MPTNDFDNTSHNKKKNGKYSIDNNFQQQRLKSWQPLLTPSWVILTFFIIGVAFIPIGVGIILAANSVTAYHYRYDNVPTASQCNIIEPDGSCLSTVTIPITENMNSPVYFYYELSNYFQNHRRYVQSRSDQQLANDISGITWSDCDPLSTYQGEHIYPCGLIANSIFNDSYSASVTYQDGTERYLGGPTSAKSTTTWQKDGIAWKTDVNDKYVEVPYNEVQQQDWIRYGPNTPPGATLPNVTDEDFIVWMRVAAMPTFRKLHRIINTDLPAGSSVQVNVTNIYPVHLFDGTKSIVLSTTSWMGGKNTFLGWAYIAVGIICMVLSAIFAVKVKLDPRPLGDLRYLNFNDLK